MQLACCQRSLRRCSLASGPLQRKLSRTPRRPCPTCASCRTRLALLSRYDLGSDWLDLVQHLRIILLVFCIWHCVPILSLLQRFVLPVTSAQEFGFFSTPLIAKNPLFHHARSSCEVTSYADRYYSMSGRSPYARKPES